MGIDTVVQVIIAVFIGVSALWQFTQVRISRTTAIVSLKAQLYELDKVHKDDEIVLKYILYRCAVGMRMCRDTFGPSPLEQNIMISDDHPTKQYFRSLLEEIHQLPLALRSKALTPLINVLHVPDGGGTGNIYSRVERIRTFLHLLLRWIRHLVRRVMVLGN